MKKIKTHIMFLIVTLWFIPPLVGQQFNRVVLVEEFTRYS